MLKEFSRRYAVLVCAIAAASCGGGGSVSSAPPPPAPAPAPAPSGQAVEHVVSVTATDPAIATSFGSNHYAYVNTSVTQRGRLFLFLGSTESEPQFYTRIETAAANEGFHSLGLAFPNGPSPVNLACSGNADPDCTGKIREETFTGTDVSPHIDVNVANSIQNRLLKVLINLRDTYPSEGWDRYVSGSTINWGLIRVSGLSQGGGLAGYIARHKASVDRACFFSSPADWDSLNNQPAAWVRSGTSLTPASRIYGFNHEKDPVVSLSHIREVWQEFGLDAFGAPADVDSSGPNYNNSHELTTSLGGVLSAHTSTAADLNTPLVNGVPVYLDAWRYACFR